MLQGWLLLQRVADPCSSPQSAPEPGELAPIDPDEIRLRVEDLGWSPLPHSDIWLVAPGKPRRHLGVTGCYGEYIASRAMLRQEVGGVIIFSRINHTSVAIPLCAVDFDACHTVEVRMAGLISY